MSKKIKELIDTNLSTLEDFKSNIGDLRNKVNDSNK
jgi:hypothetical protein